MDIKSDLWTKAAKQRSQSGPIFGETDLVIDSNPTASMESSTDLPNAYQFPSHINLASDEQDNLLAGRKGFVVDDLETFYYECKILWLSNELKSFKADVSSVSELIIKTVIFC